MASAASTLSMQPLTFKTFDDSEGEFCNDEVLVRLIHFWEARNFTKGNILIGLQLLLIDTKSTVMQGFIAAHHMFRYESKMKANAFYKLKKFMLKPSKPLFKVSDHKYELSFTNQSTLVEVCSEVGQIDEQRFRLRLSSDFAAIVDRNGDLFDLIGKIRLIRGDNLHSPNTEDKAPDFSEGKSKDIVFLHLLLKDGETMRIYLWEKVAAAFREKWNASATKPTLLLLTTVNPKTVGGALTLSSTASTRLFFDSEIPETNQNLNWLGENTEITPTVTTSSSAVTKLETVMLNEIHQFLNNETPQVASFICVVTIEDIIAQYGWHYIACSNCKTKLGKSGTSLYCRTCNKTNNIGIVRYRFEISVRDNTDLATFVIMDTDGTKFAGRTAAEVMKQSTEGGGHENSEDINNTTPQCLLHIIGRTCKFQVKVTKNFEAARQTFTVSRVIEDNINVQPKPGEKSSTTMTDGEVECMAFPDPKEFTQKKKQKVDETNSVKRGEEIVNK